jgi:hypothetical protein
VTLAPVSEWDQLGFFHTKAMPRVRCQSHLPARRGLAFGYVVI